MNYATTVVIVSTLGIPTIVNVLLTTLEAIAKAKWTTVKTNPATMAPPAGDMWEGTSVMWVHCFLNVRCSLFLWFQQSQGSHGVASQLWRLYNCHLHVITVYARLYWTELRDRDQWVPVSSMPEWRHLHWSGGTLHLLLPSWHAGYASTYATETCTHY